MIYHHRRFIEYGLKSEYTSYDAWTFVSPWHTSFHDYSVAKGIAIFSIIIGEVLWGQFWVELVISMIEAIPRFCLFLAWLHWSSYAKSRRYVMSASFAAPACPMLAGLFPISHCSEL